MSYKMRTRKQTNIYVDWLSSDEDYDSSYSDPDYSRTRPQRRSRKNLRRLQDKTNVVISSSINNPIQNSITATFSGVAGSSRNGGGDGDSRLPRRPPVRPPNDNVVRVEQRPIRRRRRSLSLRRPRISNWINKEELEKKKTVLSWLIDLGLIKENQRVWYLDQSGEIQRMGGYIKRGGVLCDCCHKVITVYEFENHAKMGHLKEPYAYIYFPCWGVSMLHFMKRVWETLPGEMASCGFNLIKPRENATDKNDDACRICADGGDLICCEKCPSTFHSNCMKMKNTPLGDWLCPFCVCKFCAMGGGCEMLHVCIQCERRFHMDCFLERLPFSLNCPSAFCGMGCSQVFTDIQQKFLGVRNDLDYGFSWSLVRMIQDNQPHSNLEGHKIGVCNSKVAIAWTVMDEIFLPNIDRLTEINIIQSVVYNRQSNLTRINFRGFYTAVLEKNDEIISAASIRIHGNKVAEMPFIGTRERFRNKGMLHKLLTQIEAALRYLKVENLVIPSVPELVPLWIEKYGFSFVGDDIMEELINYNTLTFPSAVRLHKSLVSNAAGPYFVANSAGQSIVTTMEVVGAKNNETWQTKGNNSRKVALFDLNLAPPDDDDYA